MVSPMWLSHLQHYNGTNMSLADSQRFIQSILKLGARSEYRHKWSKGDFVVWDNRALYHSATRNDDIPTGELRLLHRIRFSGGVQPRSSV